MLTHRIRLVLGAVTLAALSLLGGCSDKPDGGALVQDRCDDCHSLDRISSATKSRDDWEATVDRMITRGAVLDQEEREAVVVFLTKTYP